jgi:ribonucleoside-diphosphate reductase alpha chain
MTTGFTYAQALEASTTYFNGDELAAKVFVDKYALRDSEGNVMETTPDAMHDRLAKEFARIDADKYGLNFDERFKVYRDAINHFARIVAQGSPMSAIGNPYQVMSASNCVVVASPKDSMEGIMTTALELAQLYKRRCGVGVDLSTLRPEGTKVNNAARTTSGAWSFADLYSYVTRMVGQNSRRGALMLTMDVHHPDVVKFSTMKHDLTKVTGANISVRLSDDFLKAVESNKTYEQYWPLEGEPKIKKQVNAREVWNVIVNSATKTAEPGLIMWNNITENLPAHCYPTFKTTSTNPCSELPLSDFDSCRLISINLTAYVTNAFTKNAEFDYKKFIADVRIAQQMADNLVDLELELIDKIRSACDTNSEKDLWSKLWQAAHDGRRTGLGTHGLADTLSQLCIRYDSDQALDAVDKIYKALRDTAYDASIELAKERGSFPAHNKELEQKCEFIKRLPKALKEKMSQYGRRNISLLTQAPTGSVSIVSKVGNFDRYNVSSGVEPVFRNTYTRRKKINHDDKMSRVDFTDALGDKWQEFKVCHSNVQNYLDYKGTSDAEKLPSYFITSDEISWKKRVELQGVEQQYIDHAISSTINLPRGTTPEVVGTIYLEAWKKGLKGVTVYVDGSRDGVLISASNNSSDGRPIQVESSHAPKRPAELSCDIKKVKVQGEAWTIFVGLLNGAPYEVFGGLSKYIDIPNKYKTGKIAKNGKVEGVATYNLTIGEGDDQMLIKDIVSVFENANFGALTRMLSLGLRHGTPVQYIVEQLQKDKHSDMISFSKVIARVLKGYIKDGTFATDKTCPECKKEGSLIYQEGCLLCQNCSYSRCG